MAAWRASLAIVLAACGGSSPPPPPATPAPPISITPRQAPTLLDAALEPVQVRSVEWLRPPTSDQHVSSRDVADLAEAIREAASQTLVRHAKPGELWITVMCTAGAQDLLPSAHTVDPASMAAFREKLATIRKLPVHSGVVMFRVRLAIQPW